jgi:hypothetical protein
MIDVKCKINSIGGFLAHEIDAVPDYFDGNFTY